MELTENELSTCLAVFSELRKMPYGKLNTFLGSLTIEEMEALERKMRRRYYGKEQDNG